MHARWLTGLVLLGHAGLLCVIAAVHSPAFDEVGHLPAGMMVWRAGRFDLYRVNPPLVKAVAAVPAVLARPGAQVPAYSLRVTDRPEWEVGRKLITANGYRSFRLWTYARWACIPFSLLGGWICYVWARELSGEGAGLLALGLWCFEPNILGNGGMITPDLGATTCGLLAAYTFSRWLKTPTPLRAGLAGAALGLAELSKMSWIILFVLWPLLFVAHRLLLSRPARRDAPDRGSEPEFSRADESGEGKSGLRRPPVGQLVLILFLGWDLLNLGYLGQGSFAPLGEFEFQSAALAGRPVVPDKSPRTTGNRFRGTWLEHVPVPLPWDYVVGLDVQKLDFDKRKWSFLCGEFKLGGWWYYYIVALALKVPLGYWLLGFLAIGSAAARRCRGVRSTVGAADWLTLVVPPLALFVLVSAETGFSRYVRYVLPMFPFAFIAMSSLARALAGPGRRVMKGLVAGAVLWAVGSSLWQYPHSLSYMNELAGGPRRGHRYLNDANLSWGQDVFFLADWIHEHPQARPLTVAYVSFFDLSVAGIEFPMTPSFDPEHSRSARNGQDIGPRPGWHIVDIHYLRSHRHYYDYFHDFEPVDYIAGSMHVFHLSVEDANVARRKLGLPPLPAGTDPAGSG